MRLWIALLLSCACGSSSHTPDAAAPMTYGSFIQVTLAAPDIPKTERMWMGTMDIDTNPSAAATSGCKPSNPTSSDKPDYCVIAYTKITLASGARLTAHGSRPLVLIATSSFDLEFKGTIDVSSDPTRSGAGANPTGMCQGTAATGHSGGYGGSFGGKGGDGGKPLSGTGEAGGVAAAPLVSIPNVLRGGCPGGSGADGTGGAGGDGGGAVLIFSPMITVNGTINASGAGGKGGPDNGVQSSGAGGGGSGGMIVLDTPSPIITSGTPSLFANGGGGGQGGTATDPGAGPGDNGGQSSAAMTAAPAGNNTNRSGGAGGIGSYGTSKTDGAPAGNAFNSGGGGAGGGGAGFIHTPPIPGATLAPSST